MVFVAKSVRIVIQTLFLRFTTNEIHFSTTAMEIFLLIEGKEYDRWLLFVQHIFLLTIKNF